MADASLGYVGYGLETTEGVQVAPTVFLPVNSFSFDSTHAYIIPEEIRGTRDRYVAMSSAYNVSGTMEMNLHPEGLGPLLISALSANGGVTPSAYSGGGYQHIIVPGNTSPTFTFEAEAEAILIMRYGGIRVNTFELNAAFNEIVTASFGLEGTTRSKRGSATTASYTTVSDPFHFTGASVKVAGATVGNVKTVRFSVGLNIDRVGTLRKTLDWYKTRLGQRDIGLAATMDFTDTVDYDHFLAEDEFAVQLHFEGDYIAGTSGPKHALVIDIPRVRWNMVNAPLTAGGQIEQSVEATVLRKKDNTPIVTVTLVTTESTLLGA